MQLRLPSRWLEDRVAYFQFMLFMLTARRRALSFPLGLELDVAALRRRRARRLHYSMSSWLLAVSSTTENRS
jgi:hypothetical protein